MKPGKRLPADSNRTTMACPGHVENHVSGILVFSKFTRQCFHISSRTSCYSQDCASFVQVFLRSFLGGRNPAMLFALQVNSQPCLLPGVFRAAVFKKPRR